MVASKPFKIRDFGNDNTTQLVLKVQFEPYTNLSSLPILTAYDDDTLSSIGKEIFAGTPSFANPLLVCVDTTHAVAPANWLSTMVGGSAGHANPNTLKGVTNYVQLGNGQPIQSEYTFNLGIRIPDDISIPSQDSLAHSLALSYFTTGPLQISWYAWAEGDIDWTLIADLTETSRIVYSDDPTPYNNIIYPLKKLSSGIKLNPEGWIVEN